jgi:Na+-translocating ferredoxin:NAD+ oxidoreductase RnfA subunit
MQYAGPFRQIIKMTLHTAMIGKTEICTRKLAAFLYLNLDQMLALLYTTCILGMKSLNVPKYNVRSKINDMTETKKESQKEIAINE